MTTVTIFQRGNTSSSLNTIMKDITGDSQKHYFANNTEVYFAIRLTGPTPEKLLDTSYFKFELVQKSYIKDNSPSGHSSSSTPIEYEYCGDRFPHVSQEVYNRAGLSTYLCPKHTNFFVRANYNSDNYEMVQINIFKCNGSSCKSDAEIKNVLITHSIELAIISSYLDFEDYDNPVHYYLQDLNVFTMTPLLSQKVEYQVKQNKVTLNDNIWLGAQGWQTETQFYSSECKQVFLSDFDHDKSFIRFFFILDPQINQYTRTVYSFLDMLGFIGGLYGMFKTFGFFIVNYLTIKQFYSSVILKLYHVVEKNVRDGSERKSDRQLHGNREIYNNFIDSNKIVPKRPTSGKLVNPSGIDKDIHEELKSDISVSPLSQVKSDQENYIDKLEKYSDLTSNRLLEEINKNQKFKYSIKDTLCDLLYLYKCKCKNKECEKIKQKHELFKIGENNFNSELDCVNVINSIRELKYLVSTLLDQNQQETIKFILSKPLIPTPKPPPIKPNLLAQSELCQNPP